MTTVRDYANYDYTTGQQMQPQAPSQLDLFLAQNQTTVPDGAAPGVLQDQSDDQTDSE